jgi:holo-[acyl-carrier protein] synthase
VGPDTLDDVVAEAVEVLPIAEVAPLVAGTATGPFTPGELAYARDKSDPERRLAARLAAKRAAVRLLGPGIETSEVEIVRVPGGPPRLRLSARAAERLRALGAGKALVSLTHGREHAAAAVLLVRDPA